MTTTDDSTGIALGAISLLVFVALYVWTALALAAVFRKSGEEGWKAWVPVLNQIVLLQLGRLSGWLVLLVLIPFAGPLILWALLVVACYRINLSFGHGVGMTVLAALLLPVWASILGFGPARWLGPEPAAREQGGGPRRASSAVPADDELPRATPPAGGWTPPPMPPAPAAGRSTFAAQTTPAAGRWGEFDLGAVSEVTSEVTGADSGAPAPIAAVPVRSAPAAPSAPPAPRAASPSRAAPTFDEPLVTKVPAAAQRAAEPDAGAPRSARASVSAQHTKAEIPEDPIDETVTTRRRRTGWSLVPPSGGAVPITADVVLLGRRPSPDRAFPEAQLIPIDDGTVSKTHARLALREDRWYVTDLGSTNGVLFATLMGTEVEATPHVEVEAGERFLLGDAEVRLQRSGA